MDKFVVDLAALRRGVAEAVYLGVQDAAERVAREFGPVIAQALRGAMQNAAIVPSSPELVAPTAPTPAPRAPAPSSKVQFGRVLPPAILALADRLYGAICDRPWRTAEQLADDLGVPTAKLTTPLLALRGMTGRHEPSGDEARIQQAGVKRAARYAPVGLPVPEALRTPKKRTRR